jgi:hypothetical protein
MSVYAKTHVWVAGCLGLLTMAGCSDYSETYDSPIEQVSVDMMRADFPREARSGLLAMDDVSLKKGPGHRVEWKFRRGQLYVGSLVALAEPQGDSRTTLTVSFDPGSADSKDQKVVDAQNFITAVGLPVMFESLDARIEKRGVNDKVLESAMVSYVKNNTGAIGRETQATFDEVGRKLNEASTETSQTEFISRTPDSYTKPTLDLSREPRSASDMAIEEAQDVMP